MIEFEGNDYWFVKFRVRRITIRCCSFCGHKTDRYAFYLIEVNNNNQSQDVTEALYLCPTCLEQYPTEYIKIKYTSTAL